MVGLMSSTSVRTASRRARALRPRTFHDSTVVLSMKTRTTSLGPGLRLDHRDEGPTARLPSTCFGCREELVHGHDFRVHQVPVEEHIKAASVS